MIRFSWSHVTMAAALLVLPSLAFGSYLGVAIRELDAERVKALNLREERGVEVTRVADDSPASRGGLKNGDVITDWNGQKVEGLEQFMRLVRETPSGRQVSLNLVRNGAQQQLTLTTGDRKMIRIPEISGSISLPGPEVGESMREFFRDMPQPGFRWKSGVLGIEGEGLEPQLAQFFGVKEGVLIRAIVKDSPAEKAGLRAGDVVVKVDDAQVSTPGEIATIVRNARAKRQVSLQVVREKREMAITVPVEVAEGVPVRGRLVHFYTERN